MLNKAAVFICIFLVGCSADPKLVNFELPTRPQSCTERPKELSKKDVKRDLDLVEAVDWHIDDRIKYAKERAKWIDCQRFLKRTWQNMQSK